MSSYPHGITDLVLRGVPVEVPNPGEAFWVNNSSVLAKGGSTGSNGNAGTYQHPFSTIDYAIGRCKAGRGDKIYVMPGHIEDFGDTTAGGFIDVDVQGISIIGLGTGTLQPRIDFNHADSDFFIDADDVTISNIHFSATVTVVAIGVSVLTGATNTVINNCRFSVETTTTDEFLIAINYGVGCDRLVVENCEIDMGLGGAATGIKLVGATAGANIRNNRIVGDYSLACIAGLTTLSTELYIEDNILVNGGSAAVGTVAVLNLVAASTGMFRGNTVFCNVATGVLQMVSTGLFFSDNWQGEDPGSAATAGMSRGVGLDIASIVPFADG